MNRTVRYTLADPTKNYTLLVQTPVPIPAQPAVAAQLMRLEPLAEQVGFFEDSADGVHLRMAGGEFCGNAAMSAAVLRAHAHSISEADIPVHVRGAETTVRVRVQERTDGCFAAAVEMPPPLSVETQPLPECGSQPIVFFPGIAHVILRSALPNDAAERLAPIWCAHLHTQAIGIMQFDEARGFLTPLVYVPSADTLFWENSCASGTAALGHFLFAERKSPVDAHIAQKGGTLHIAVDAHGALRLGGHVRILRQREVQLPDAAE